MPAVWSVWVQVERRGGHHRWTASRPLTYTRALVEVGRFERMGHPAKIEAARLLRAAEDEPPRKKRKSRANPAPDERQMKLQLAGNAG